MNFPMPVMDPCPFCEFTRGSEAWNLLVADPLTLTLLNGRQYETGQCIVMPRRHAPTLLDLTAHEAAAVMLAVQRIGAAITKIFNSRCIRGVHTETGPIAAAVRSSGASRSPGPRPTGRSQRACA